MLKTSRSHNYLQDYAVPLAVQLAVECYFNVVYVM